MLALRPEFHLCAGQRLATAAGSHDQAQDSETTAHGTPALNRFETPYKSLMRNIDRLIKSGNTQDLCDAFRLVRSIVTDGVYTGRDHDQLVAKLDKIINLIHGEAGLGGGFTRSATGLPLVIAPNPDNPGTQPFWNYTPVH